VRRRPRGSEACSVRRMPHAAPVPTPSITWALVADRAEARFFERRGPKAAFVPIEAHHHPEARIHAHESPPVTTKDADGTPQQPLPIERAPSVHELDVFAKALAERLRHARTDGRFDRLVLAAEPTFLGRLRAALDDATRKLVTEEIPKHLVGAADLQERLAAIPRLG
jgi:protein required for attachment to host cells